MISLKPLGSNMTEIEIEGYKVLFSYQTPVAYSDSVGLCFITDKYWSRTTSKHINKWLEGRPSKKIPQESINKLLVNSYYQGRIQNESHIPA